MARPLEKISDVNDEKELWKVAVKIHHKWSVISNNKEHFEMVVYDSEGSDIHVIVPPVYRQNFDSVFVVNDTYTIANFQVQLNDLLFKPSAHKYLLKFTGGTKVGDRNVHQIQEKACRLTPFLDILTGKWNKDQLLDVIGVVDEIGYTQVQVGSKKQQVNFVIRDLRFKQQHYHGYVMGGVSGAVYELRKYPLSVTNTYNVTKLTINEDVETIKQFAKMLTQDTIVAVSGLLSHQSQGRSQNSYSSRQSPTQKLLSNAVLLPLEQIVKLKDTTFCATVATIAKIVASKYGWYYQACHECPNKVTGDSPPYKCVKGHETETAIFRYKIEVGVLHAGTKCKFVLWDKESEDLLEVSAAHMRETMFQAGIFDPLDYPLTLDKLLNQELAFKVKWQPNWSNCSVIMLVKDKPVVDQLKSEWVEATTVNSQQLSAPVNHIKESVDEAVPIDDSDIVTDPEITSKLHGEPVTPTAKRQSPDPSIESTSHATHNEGDLSSTKLKKPARITRKLVKIEK
ncbi:uncharacterized protein LOC131596005 [Vicia villosa]|uniref:uncharacterized protein LOC131596005 n=1 Tax=Vicia villosa TaxID=3911 RepID=UPI00273B75B5|nr:uncharacterized protein LOC131596005 [Vicia villosa]